MKHTYSLSALLALALLTSTNSRAQSLVGGFMAGKGHGSVVFTGTAERYTNVFLVPDKVNGVPLFQEIRVSSVSAYVNHGITDRIEAVVSLPYIKSEGKSNSEGFTNSRAGLQDISGLLKFKAYSTEVGNNVLDLLGVVGVSTPASNYQSDQGLEYIIAIGNRATKLNTAGIAHLKTPSGVFLTGQVGYSLRSSYVPNAFVGDLKVGYAGVKTYVEAWASFQESSSEGTDILQPGFDGRFTATRVSYTRIGASLYQPIAKGVGLVLGASRYIAGRNVGQSTGVSAGVSYNY
jgi:hypothetical protein